MVFNSFAGVLIAVASVIPISQPTLIPSVNIVIVIIMKKKRELFQRKATQLSFSVFLRVVNSGYYGSWI